MRLEKIKYLVERREGGGEQRYATPAEWIRRRVDRNTHGPLG